MESGFGVMRTTGCKKKKPVGVFEANASLLEFVSVLQFGHIFSVDGRLGHGLLEKGRQGKRRAGIFIQFKVDE